MLSIGFGSCVGTGWICGGCCGIGSCGKWTVVLSGCLLAPGGIGICGNWTVELPGCALVPGGIGSCGKWTVALPGCELIPGTVCATRGARITALPGCMLVPGDVRAGSEGSRVLKLPGCMEGSAAAGVRVEPRAATPRVRASRLD